MIIYDQRHWAGLPLIFQITGSIYPRCLPHILISCSVVATLKALEYWTDITWFKEVFDHPYVYQIYTFVLGFIMVFRSSLAYSRFWEGRTELETMSAKWGDAALLSVVFDNASKDGVVPTKDQWRWQLLSLTSLLHGMSLASLGGVTSFEVLAGADPSCLEAFENDKITDKCNLAFVWVQDIITKRHTSGGLDIPSPIISRIFQELSTGMLAFNNALKIHDTPFPFPYVQLISVCLLILTLTSGFVMHIYVQNLFWSMLFTAIAVGGYHAINEVAVELEDPFGDDANDLPMDEYQRSFNARLLTMSYMNSLPFECPPAGPDFEPPQDMMDTAIVEDHLVRLEGEDIPIKWVSHLSHCKTYIQGSEQLEEASNDDGSCCFSSHSEANDLTQRRVGANATVAPQID